MCDIIYKILDMVVGEYFSMKFFFVQQHFIYQVFARMLLYKAHHHAMLFMCVF